MDCGTFFMSCVKTVQHECEQWMGIDPGITRITQALHDGVTAQYVIIGGTVPHIVRQTSLPSIYCSDNRSQHVGMWDRGRYKDARTLHKYMIKCVKHSNSTYRTPRTEHVTHPRGTIAAVNDAIPRHDGRAARGHRETTQEGRNDRGS